MLPKSLGKMEAYIVLNTSQWDKAIMRVRQSVDTIAFKMRKLGTEVSTAGMAMTQAGLAMISPWALAARSFASFDDAMRLTAAVTQETGDILKRLSEEALYLGRTTSFTAQQVAEGMIQLGRAGFSGKEIQQSMAAILDLARSTGTDLSEASRYASSTLRAFSLEAGEMLRVVDVLTATANRSAQTLTDLGESMKYAAPIAADFGMSLEETAKAMGTMANFAIRGSLAGTSLRMIMLRLGRTRVQKKLEAIGVSVKDVTGNFRPLYDILQDMHKTLSRLGSADQMGIMADVFGARAISGGIKLAKRSFDELNRAIENAAGTAQDTADKMDAGLGGSIRLLRSAVESLSIAFGEAFSKELQAFNEWARQAVTDAIRWVKLNKQLIITTGKWIVEFLKLGAIVFLIGKAISALGGLLTMFKSLWGVVVKIWGVLKWMLKFPGLLSGILTASGIVGIATAILGIVMKIRKEFDSTADTLGTEWVKAWEDGYKDVQLIDNAIKEARENVKALNEELARKSGSKIGRFDRSGLRQLAESVRVQMEQIRFLYGKRAELLEQRRKEAEAAERAKRAEEAAAKIAQLQLQWKKSLVAAEQLYNRYLEGRQKFLERAREKEKKIAWRLMELSIRLNNNEINAKRKLLDLEKKRAIQSARQYGVNLELVRKEYELKRMLLEKEEEARRRQMAAGAPNLAQAVERGSAEAYNAVVRREEEATRKIQTNTKKMVQTQKETNTILKDFKNRYPQIIDLGL